jgi:adenine-specific DNA methylase
MKDLLKKATVKAKYVLISFSDEGHIDSDGWDEILQPYWSEVFQKDHRSTMGTRNYEKRGKSTVVEVLYLVWAKNKGLPGPRHAGECLAPC